MSGTLITLEFFVVVDSELDEDDVADNLRRAMAATGQRYIDQHPELFRTGTSIV